MRKHLHLLAFSLCLVLSGCQKESIITEPASEFAERSAPCNDCVPEPVVESWNTTANNNGNYAKIEAWNDQDYFYIRVKGFKADGITPQTFDAVSLSYPFNYVLNGQPRNCNYQVVYQPENEVVVTTTEHTYTFPKGLQCDVKSFAIRVAGLGGNNVILKGTDGSVSGTYQQGNNTLSYTCNNVPTAVTYSIYEICPPCNIQPGDYRTQGQGYYFSSPPGKAFMLANPSLGPVRIGCGRNMMSYSIADIIAIAAGNSTDPGITVKQLITLTLNVNAASIWGTGDLNCLRVAEGVFEGLSVAQIIAEANNVIGGCETTLSSLQQSMLTDVLTSINENFLSGTINNGFLTCGTCD